MAYSYLYNTLHTYVKLSLFLPLEMIHSLNSTYKSSKTNLGLRKEKNFVSHPLSKTFIVYQDSYQLRFKSFIM